MKTIIVRLGAFNFVDVKVPVALLRNPRWFRRWFRGLVQNNPSLQGLNPCACQFSAGWGKNWHGSTNLIYFG